HHIHVDLRVPVRATPTRKAVSFAIPEAASTSLDLDFTHRESDIIIGSNENYGLKELADGKVTRLSAHLEPRSQLEVSWTNSGGPGGQGFPPFTHHGGKPVCSRPGRTRGSP